MKNKLFQFFLFLGLSTSAQLPQKIDSLIPVYLDLKDDTFKVDRLLWIATNTATSDTVLSSRFGKMGFELAKKLNDKKNIGNSYKYFGTRHYYIQNYDQAISCYEKATTYYKESHFLKGIANVFNNCGAIYNEKGEFKKAIEFHKKALEINIQAKNEEGVGNNYLNLGNTYNLTGEYKTAMEYFIKAEKIYSNLKLWESLATTLYNIGYVHYNLHQYERALEYNTKAMKLREEKTGNKIGLAYCHVFFGAVYGDTAIKDYVKANYHYGKVVELCEQTGDRITQLSALLNIGKNYYNRGLNDSAVIYAQRSLKLSRELGHGKFIMNALFNTGEALLKKNPAQAMTHFKESYELAAQTGDLAMIASNADGLSKSYFALKQYKEAYQFLQLFSNKKDALFSKDILKTVTEMEAKYQNEKKQLEIDNLNKDKQVNELVIIAQEKENAAKNKILFIGTIGLIGLGVFAFLAYSNFKKTQKANLIINSQKQQVELQKEEISTQKDLVVEKQKEIIDSINYAQKIQSAVLTGESVWNKISSDYFIIFQPKDIVSGDFYWAYNTLNNRSVIVLADCTGHGVPGGFMSMLGNSFLNEIVVENKIFKPDQILNKLRQKIISSLGQKGSADRRDGMDMAVCTWNKIDNTLEFSGANNKLWIIRKGELSEYPGDKMPIGNFDGDLTPFKCYNIQLHKNDSIVLSTDGFADQFGGDGGKKFMSKNLKNLLVNNSDLSLENQKNELINSLNSWKGNHEQVDDISLIIIKVV